MNKLRFLQNIQFLLLSYLVLAIYSWCLIDPNLTLFTSIYFEYFREAVVKIGYFQKNISIGIFLLLIVSIFYFYKQVLQSDTIFFENFSQKTWQKLLIFLGILSIFSYPFLSHDLFNYLFDAKIVTLYQQNPYLMRPMDFVGDPWLRFMHWIHRTYPYGPSFLPLTILVTFLAMNKLVLSILFYRLLVACLYILSFSLFAKIDKRVAFLLAFNPILIIEGMINGHNDLFSLFFIILAIYSLDRKYKISAWILYLISAMIKYLSIAQFVFLLKTKKYGRFSLIATLFLVIYISTNMVFQPWYLLNLLIFEYYYPGGLKKTLIFCFFAMLSYMPYILATGWGVENAVVQKNIILSLGVLMNAFYLFRQQRS